LGRRQAVRHNRGAQKSTAHKGPWNIIYKEEYQGRQEAVARERYLKSLKSSKYIRSNIIK